MKSGIKQMIGIDRLSTRMDPWAGTPYHKGVLQRSHYIISNFMSSISDFIGLILFDGRHDMGLDFVYGVHHEGISYAS